MKIRIWTNRVDQEVTIKFVESGAGFLSRHTEYDHESPMYDNPDLVRLELPPKGGVYTETTRKGAPRQNNQYTTSPEISYNGVQRYGAINQ